MYRISVVKVLGGVVESLPMVTIEGKRAAMDKLEQYVDFYRSVMNAPDIRKIGGGVELILERVGGVLDDGERLQAVSISRAVDSPIAEVRWHD